jgi:hypothetical protein
VLLNLLVSQTPFLSRELELVSMHSMAFRAFCRCLSPEYQMNWESPRTHLVSEPVAAARYRGKLVLLEKHQPVVRQYCVVVHLRLGAGYCQLPSHGFAVVGEIPVSSELSL